ncbi:MAG TPA: DinB family protein [Anaerolineales bacterium]
MSEIFLTRLFEHNNWANQRIIEVCSALSDKQLDAEPQSVTKGTIRRTLVHLVSSQASYLKTLTLPLEERLQPTSVEFSELKESAAKSGESLLGLARGEQKPFSSPLQTRDGYHVEPWVIMVQIINHATEHREQINSMLSALGITPPDMDGWSFGEAANALFPNSTGTNP